MTNTHVPAQRRAVRAARPGGPDVLAIAIEDLPAPQIGEALVRVDAVGLNHVETLVRSGEYAVRFPFPYAVGFEGAGTVIAAGPDAALPIGARVCWTAVFGSCATHVIAPAALLARVPDDITLENAATLAHAAVTAEGLARHWPLERGAFAVVWAAAGAVGRMLVSQLADRGVRVIGIATGDRTAVVRAVGAIRAIDRGREDVAASVRESTAGRGVSAVFDPVGAATYETTISLLAPRGCLVNYGQLGGPLPPIDAARLMEAGSIFVTKFGPRAGMVRLDEVVPVIAAALVRARTQPLSPGIAARFDLGSVADAFRTMEAGAAGKVLVLPQEPCRGIAGRLGRPNCGAAEVTAYRSRPAATA